MGDPFERADGPAVRRPRPVGGRAGRRVVFGTARTTTAFPADHAARLAPLTDTDIDELLTAPRCAPAPFRHRGAAPVDPAALKDLLARLSQMADDLPELAEAERTPVLARPDGAPAQRLSVNPSVRKGRFQALRRCTACSVR